MVLCEKCKVEVGEVKEEYAIMCSECGKGATVPFKPYEGSTNLKCRDCFMKGK